MTADEKTRYDATWRAGGKAFTCVKTYGISKGNGGWYSVVTDVENDPASLYYRRSFHRIDLSYKRADFALRKAEAFVKSLHKDFVNFQGIAIHFEFINCGEVER